MKRAVCFVFVAVVLAASVCLAQPAAKPPLTVAQIKRAIIGASIAGYPGNCPCPYNVDRAGRRCGKRSAYSRPGGASPICFEEDVTAAMVAAFRKRDAKSS
jgi:hypothetical protein